METDWPLNIQTAETQKEEESNVSMREEPEEKLEVESISEERLDNEVNESPSMFDDSNAKLAKSMIPINVIQDRVK